MPDLQLIHYSKKVPGEKPVISNRNKLFGSIHNPLPKTMHITIFVRKTIYDSRRMSNASPSVKHRQQIKVLEHVSCPMIDTHKTCVFLTKQVTSSWYTSVNYILCVLWYVLNVYQLRITNICSYKCTLCTMCKWWYSLTHIQIDSLIFFI